MDRYDIEILDPVADESQKPMAFFNLDTDELFTFIRVATASGLRVVVNPRMEE